MKSIYLDYAATTPVDKRVAKIMQNFLNKVYGNPGSLHKAGREAKMAIFKAKKTIAQILNCKSEEIIFTGSGTESDNLAIFGVARANKNFGNHVITSTIEHHAVLRPFEQLEKEGFKTSFLRVDEFGLLDPDFVKKEVTDSTILVSVMYANNEIGTIQPIEKIAEIINSIREDRIKRNIKTPILFHTDACQAAGYLYLDVKKLGVDMLTINGSKIYGPKGVGLLYIKAGTKIEPMIFGGGQENGNRSGTENVAGIVGFAEALKIVSQKRKKELLRLTKLRDYFIEELFKKISKIVLNGHAQKRLPNNINVSVLDIEGEAMLLWLDKYGVFVSTGSACDSQSLDPSHVILALSRPYEYANGNIRFTLGKDTTKKNIDFVLKVFPKIVKELREISPVNVGQENNYRLIKSEKHGNKK